MESSKLAKGEYYDKLLSEFIKLNGDLNQCPFDTENYKYIGPLLKDGEIVNEIQKGNNSHY